ncbi:hypothetical protein BH20ACI2_BH20ACI2_27140 [soil metagenome]
MKFVIPLPDFAKAFGLTDNIQYEMFNEKVNKELDAKIHPSAVVDNFDFISTRNDRSGNIHALLGGNVSGFGQQKEIGGEFVWLKNLGCFRGRVWSSLEMHSDLQLLLMARDSYRKLEYHKAVDYLDAIPQAENLPHSATNLRVLLEKAIAKETRVK